MSYQENITRIRAVYNALGELKDHVVFVGGAVVSLYATRESFDPRPTEDIDIVIEVISLTHYAEIEENLRQKGFQHASESPVICRYKIDGLIVDVMPTRENIIGFSNRWYEEGFRYAEYHQIDSLHKVKIFSAPYFLASKLEAFMNRGRNDCRTSSDFEDIVYLLNNRDKVFDEILKAPQTVLIFIKEQFRMLHQNQNLLEWISCHLETSENIKSLSYS